MILLDTHVVVWLAEAPEELSETAIQEIRREREELAISDQSLWELAWSIDKGRIRIRGTVRDFLEDVERRFRVLPVNAGVAGRAIQFSERYPKDAADRLVGATALAYGIDLITRDVRIRASGKVPCVW